MRPDGWSFTATAFAGAWQRRTDAEPAVDWRVRLHRLGTLTLPRSHPEGRARVLGARDHEDLVRWCGEFLDAGATDVVLFTDPGNPAGNALYRRLGYVPIAEFTGYAFAGGGTVGG
ncbi:hypothetical protein [Saccharothrix xinjiangensis]|uniref:GNAT family N-acetyltransferase n=1 Tax=Saccharothrix xinjiangensis TaxID=204798 RepID=A0ABV9Y381_9PSEU